MTRRIGFAAAYCLFVVALLEVGLRLGGLALLAARPPMSMDGAQSSDRNAGSGSSNADGDNSNARLRDGGVDEVRILAIGESTTYGLGVAAEMAYPQQLGRMLNDDSRRRYVVINTGVPGQTSTSILRNIRYQLDKYRPHLVVAQFGVNDLNDALNDLSSRVVLGLYVPEPITRLRVFRLLMVTRDYLLLRRNHGRDGAWTFLDVEQTNPDGSWRHRPEYLRQLELNYDDVIETVRAWGAEVIVVPYLRANRNVCDAVRSVAARNRSPFVELGRTQAATAAGAPQSRGNASANPGVLPCNARDDGLFMPDRFHPNEEGHRVMAAAVLDVLRTHGLPRHAPPPVSGDGGS